ncbi:uncharacterized protein CC84DRAFT_1213897 [Paraphaeosphaeria sporulosa]|uniref:Uncharacterized protein n=1 Tax=Paraphaeosphaeria sporulosa TaxID=1460663 RepID=A0A177CUX2_9PLEO|nr:uncharacterized protein CC84DRAFT_1213897 [Paraphaeosphaeria sporulosa]OAG10587.1 hypothetical protein CC84DRAFT_1213897 [Paraphaeosphaeria sporulosa]
MNAPIVALDWLGDMSVPSILPCRTTYLEEGEKEVERSVLNSSFTHYENAPSEEREEDSGTVKRKAPSPERSDARSPIRFDGGRDLLSPGPEVSCLGRRRSGILTGLPIQFEADLEPVRGRSFLRPRIATETFKDPSDASIPRRSIPAATTNPTSIAVQEALRRRDARDVFDVFFSDALRVSPSRSPSPSSSVYSSSTGSEKWMTPPTTQKPTGRCNPVGYRYPSAISQVQPSRSAMNTKTSSPVSPNFSRPLRSVVAQDYSLPPSRKVSFADRNFPWEKDDDDCKPDRRKSSLAERSPLPAPPGQHEKRDFSFEAGLHAQETRFEQKFEGKQRRQARGDIARLATRKREREREQRAIRGSRTSGTDEPKLRQEYQRLRQEMALLREEFRALRQTLVNSRR